MVPQGAKLGLLIIVLFVTTLIATVTNLSFILYKDDLKCLNAFDLMRILSFYSEI